MTDTSQPGSPPSAPDAESSTDQYARRFRGPVGAFMLAVQEEAVLRFLSTHAGATVLDVGGGHAQLALPMARAGYRVTVLGSSPDSLARSRRMSEGGVVDHVVAGLTRLPYRDSSVDVVVSIRLLAHISDWPGFVRELCRVARSAVIVDYPSSRSVNVLAAPFFGMKKRLEGDTRRYRVLEPPVVESVFRAAGFGRLRTYPQFFWPMALHRALRAAQISRALERLPRRIGLTARWGSPVILCAEPGK